MRIKGTTGFSVLEALVAVAIFSILVLSVYGVLEAGSRLWMVTDASANNQLEARRAMMDMERQVRGGSDFLFLQPNNDNSAYGALEFVLDDETITYTREYDSAVRSYYINRATSGGPARRLASNIKLLEFSPDAVSNPQKVTITIEVEKTTLRGQDVGFSLAEEVNVRNN